MYKRLDKPLCRLVGPSVRRCLRGARDLKRLALLSIVIDWPIGNASKLQEKTRHRNWCVDKSSGHVAKKAMRQKDLTTIDKLVKTRNKIAHGTQLEISEDEFEKLMAQLKGQSPGHTDNVV